MTRKIDFTTDVVVCTPSDSELPFTCRPSVHAIDADDQGHERRLDHAHFEMRDRDGVMQARMKMAGLIPA